MTDRKYNPRLKRKWYSSTRLLVGNDDDYDYNDDEDESSMIHLHETDETQPLLRIKSQEQVKKESHIERTKQEESTINLADEIRGALIFHIPSNCFCKDYTVRIYLHYWMWQIPVLITNIILFCIWNTTHTDHHPVIALQELGFLAVGPVLLSALVRDKIFLWGVYWAVKKTPHLGCCSRYARYHISRLADCIGGLHSSFGVTSLVWNVIYAIGAFIREDYELNARSTTAFCLPFLLTVICLCALPCIRHHCHNSFEIIHRYLNWLALSILITHVVFVNLKQAPTLFDVFTNTPTILCLSLFILTVYPWVILHRIKGKDIIIKHAKQSTAFIFPWWAPMGAVCKLSTDFVEFHVMGITPLLDGTSFVLMKSLGDWTSSLNERAEIPGSLDDVTFYMSRIKPPNFTQGLFNWDRVFVLVTGAGIAPLIPYVINPLIHVQISLFWVARDHANAYPDFIVNLLDGVDNVTLYDTTKMPRPNLCELCVEKAIEFGAQAVFVVSNPKIAYHVSNYVIKQGIPVFASNFDV